MEQDVEVGGGDQPSPAGSPPRRLLCPPGQCLPPRRAPVSQAERAASLQPRHVEPPGRQHCQPGRHCRSCSQSSHGKPGGGRDGSHWGLGRQEQVQQGAGLQPGDQTVAHTGAPGQHLQASIWVVRAHHHQGEVVVVLCPRPGGRTEDTEEVRRHLPTPPLTGPG